MNYYLGGEIRVTTVSKWSGKLPRMCGGQTWGSGDVCTVRWVSACVAGLRTESMSLGGEPVGLTGFELSRYAMHPIFPMTGTAWSVWASGEREKGHLGDPVNKEGR